jgi:hypothetical protein
MSLTAEQVRHALYEVFGPSLAYNDEGIFEQARFAEQLEKLTALLNAALAEAPPATPELSSGQFDFCMEGYDAGYTKRSTVLARVNAAFALLVKREPSPAAEGRKK